MRCPCLSRRGARDLLFPTCQVAEQLLWQSVLLRQLLLPWASLKPDGLLGFSTIGEDRRTSRRTMWPPKSKETRQASHVFFSDRGAQAVVISPEDVPKWGP